MLLTLVVALALCAAGLCLVVAAAHHAAKRLRLDVWEVIVWLGLADAPVDELAVKRAEPARRAPRRRRALAS